MPEALPFTPRGLSRDLAALYVGVPPAMFDRMVADGRMPPARIVDGLSLWDRYTLDAAFSDLGATAAVATQAEPSFQPAAFSTKTLAKRWGCSERHVYNLVDQGVLPSLRLGGKLIRIRREDVEAFELGERATPTPALDNPLSEPPKKRRAPVPPLTRAKLKALRSRSPPST